MKKLITLCLLLYSFQSSATTFGPFIPPASGGSGCATTGCTMTGDILFNTAGGTDAVLGESSIDRNSGSAETFNFTNSGAGAMTLQVDGVAVTTTATACLLSGCTITGNLAIDGNTTVGNASGDSLTVNAATLSIVNASTLALANSATALSIDSGTLAIDALNNRVSIGFVGAGTDLDVGKSSAAAGTVTARVVNFTTTGSSQWSVTDADGVGSVGLQYFNNTFSTSGLAAPNVGRLVADSSATGGLLLEADGGDVIVARGGSATTNERFRISSTGSLFNNQAQDADFLVKSQSTSNLFAIDGTGAGAIGIGVTNTTVSTIASAFPLVFSGVTNDITAASGEDVLIKGGATTGSVGFQAPDNFIDLFASDAVIGVNGPNAFIAMNTLATPVAVFMANSSTGGAFKVQAATSPSRAGRRGDAGATVAAFIVADNLSQSSDGNALLSVFGSGLVVNAIQTATCNAGVGVSTLSLDIQSSYVEIVNNDADGCDVTIAETSAQAGASTTIAIVTNAGTTVNFADSAGVSHLAGAFNADINDTLSLAYSTTTSSWNETSRSAN